MSAHIPVVESKEPQGGRPTDQDTEETPEWKGRSVAALREREAELAAAFEEMREISEAIKLRGGVSPVPGRSR